MGNVHFSSASDNWATPVETFKQASDLWGPFDLDVCASKDNAKAKKFFSVEQDGLAQSWSDHASIAWMNPPYGRSISKWIAKAYEESLKGCRVVCLLPARTDTKWFHEICSKGEVTFIKGRLKFGGSVNSAPFPSMYVVFDKELGKS